MTKFRAALAVGLDTGEELFLVSHPPTSPTHGDETGFVAGQAEQQVPPLRYASVRDDKV